MNVIPIETSARHVHLTSQDWAELFGTPGMTTQREISQHKQFVAVERVTLRGPKRELTNVGIVGPFRSQTQVELAATDARSLGIDAPLSDSGVLDTAADIIIIGPQGQIHRSAAIIPRRHIHLGLSEAATFGLRDKQVVSVRVDGSRAATLENVLVRTHSDYSARVHLDTDEGNACGITTGSTAAIIP